MKTSIEQIWETGFSQEKLQLPKITAFYNQKSLSAVEKLIREFKRGVWLLIPLCVCVFLFNLWLDNDNAAFWGAVSAVPCLVWFYIGYKQLKELEQLSYGSNCYSYLISVRKKIRSINTFNVRLAMTAIPVCMLPMLIYTYYNQQGKTIGEIFGNDLSWPTAAIFLILPMMMLGAYVVAYAFSKRLTERKLKQLNSIIHDLEQLER